MKSATIADLEEIRRRAREHIEHGAVTEHYRADRATVLKLLNEALATELVCTLRYQRHYFMATGIHSRAVAEEFQEHANEEREHANRIAERIVQLAGSPDFNPEGLLSRSHSDYVEGVSLLDMIKEDLIAERIAIGSYSEIIRYLGNDDPTTRRLFEDILAKEEEHAEELSSIITALDKDVLRYARPPSEASQAEGPAKAEARPTFEEEPPKTEPRPTLEGPPLGKTGS
jgi:bacterioferritin